MNQVEELKKLYVQKKTYKIPKEPKEGQVQASIEITPLDIDQIGLADIRDDMTTMEKTKQMVKFLAVSLDESDDAVSKIGLGFMEELIGAVFDANNLKMDKANKKNIKEILDEKRVKIHESTK